MPICCAKLRKSGARSNGERLIMPKQTSTRLRLLSKLLLPVPGCLTTPARTPRRINPVFFSFFAEDGGQKVDSLSDAFRTLIPFPGIRRDSGGARENFRGLLLLGKRGLYGRAMGGVHGLYETGNGRLQIRAEHRPLLSTKVSSSDAQLGLQLFSSKIGTEIL